MIDEKNFMSFMDQLEEAGAEYVTFDDLRKFMEQQPKIREWIPCSERLPEESESYLVTTYSNGISQYISDVDHFVYNGMPDGYWINGDDVIAWQPLPEPYQSKGGKEHDGSETD